MNAIPQHRMTVDEYFAWAERHPGRFELIDGAVHPMSPETVGHAKAKAAVYLVLRTAIRRQKLPCHALPDGMTIRIDEMTAYEPDAVVYCGDELPAEAVAVPNPVAVVEVLSRSTRRIDLSAKLAAYAAVPSIAHYLIIDPTQLVIIHHARRARDAFLTRVVNDGTIILDPPGIEIAVAEIYNAMTD